jgi:C4-dicarboxylate-specific signal transduction histidine kinase
MRDILEQRVDERTADLQLANHRLRDAQGDLIQAAKLAALGQMSASLAHELNQPVAAIRGFAENGLILVERGRLPEASTNLREVVAMSERIGVITRHLKAFARRAPPDIGQVPLRPAVFHCLALMAGRMKELSVNVTVDVADGLIVTAEEVRIEQVIINLLQNACDAVSDAERREILIDADSSGAWIEMRVRDSGPGIALEILPRLFDSFFTTKSAGLGLGLSISRDIIREFGGRIEAMNATKGGSLFVIRLPAAA